MFGKNSELKIQFAQIKNYSLKELESKMNKRIDTNSKKNTDKNNSYMSLKNDDNPN
jgi:hypothetical protein